MLTPRDYYRLTVLLVQMLYQETISRKKPKAINVVEQETLPLNNLPEQETNSETTPEEKIILKNLLQTCTHNVSIIEETIKNALHRPFERLDVTLQSILRLGVGEMLLRQDHFGPCPLPERPFGKVIGTYLHISHAFFDEDVGRLVHGVLSHVLKANVPCETTPCEAAPSQKNLSND